MMMRDRKHYENLIARNPRASVGFEFAAAVVYAIEHGYCESSNRNDPRYAAIARRLKSSYGEQLTPDQMHHEMRI